MLALFAAVAAVAVERYVNKRRLKLHEVLSDVGWLTLVFAFIEFAYLLFVETFTLNFGPAARPLWHTEWGVFKSLLLESAIGILLILTSTWLESAGLRVELRRPTLRMPPRPHLSAPAAETPSASKCDVEW